MERVRWNAGGFCLKQAYLNLYQRAHHSEREFIALHCDPEDSLLGTDAKYRSGPHLHVKAAEPPIPKAHIALAAGHLENVFASMENLFEAMVIGIQMVADEILAEFPAH